jgi:nicotinamidase-related amidase
LSGRRGRSGSGVVWVQQSDERLVPGSDAWRIVAELAPGDGEPLIDKHYAAARVGLGVGRLVVVGAQTDECIRSTLHGAIVRGYDAILVSDAHTTEDLTAWRAPPPDQVICTGPTTRRRGVRPAQW